MITACGSATVFCAGAIADFACIRYQAGDVSTPRVLQLEALFAKSLGTQLTEGR